MIKRHYKYTAAFFILMGCATGMRIGESKLIGKSGQESFKTLSGPGVFIGVSKKFSDESSARNDAELDARRQIINSLEIKIETALAETLITRGNDAEILSADVFSHSRTQAAAANILSVAPMGFYVERWCEKKVWGVAYYFKAWCFIKYAREDHNRMLEQVVTDICKTGEPLLDDAVRLRRQGRIREAMSRLQRIMALKDDFAGYRAIPKALTSRIDDIIMRAEDVMRGITILVVVDEKIHDIRSDQLQFEPRLVSAMGNMDVFSVKSSSVLTKPDYERIFSEPEHRIEIARTYHSDLMLTGSAIVDYSVEKQGGFYIARSKGMLDLVEVATGVVLWETSLPGDIVIETRGFANTDQRAAERALSLADYPADQGEPFTQLSDAITKAICGLENAP